MKRLVIFFLKKALKIVLYFIVFSLVQVVLFRYIPVYYTPLMVYKNTKQFIKGKKIICRHSWQSLDKISKELPLAVICSEDNLFLKHQGFDFNQIMKSIEDFNKKGKRLRGASTISQQTAKNVFLWNGRSFIRKGLEAYYTVLIELIWSKKRIMEVYLNSIEMGENTYGAEAVARFHFNKKAIQLSRDESALIAISLPNPIYLNSEKPSHFMKMRKMKIMALMQKLDPINFD